MNERWAERVDDRKLTIFDLLSGWGVARHDMGINARKLFEIVDSGGSSGTEDRDTEH